MLLVGPRRVQGRERLGQFPEPGVLADAVIDQEPLQGVGSTAGEEEHGLVDPVEGRGTGTSARFTLGLQTELGFQAEKPGFTCTVCAQSESKPR